MPERTLQEVARGIKKDRTVSLVMQVIVIVLLSLTVFYFLQALHKPVLYDETYRINLEKEREKISHEREASAIERQGIEATRKRIDSVIQSLGLQVDKIPYILDNIQKETNANVQKSRDMDTGALVKYYNNLRESDIRKNP